MRSHPLFPNKAKKLFLFTFTFLLLTSIAPKAVLAHAGHGDEFHNDSQANQSPTGIKVDAETVKRMGILVQPVTRRSLDIGVTTTGEIETLPSQKVEVTAPIAGKILQLLVEPGEIVKKNQTLAILLSHELAEMRVNSLEKGAEAEGNIKEAEANFNLAKDNYNRALKSTEAEISQAQVQLEAARSQYERDKSVIDEKAVLGVAKENYQRQIEIAEAEISQAETELAVAGEQYDRDRELAEKGAIPRRQMLESKAHFAEAEAAVAKAKSRRDVLAAETEVKRAEVDLPFRDMRESQAKLAEAQAQLTKAKQRREVGEAEAEVKRAEAALDVAKSRLELSSTAYETRLKQMGTAANEDGTVTIAAPISGKVAHREITPGESLAEAGKPLMTILDDSRVWATANIYEKDLDRVKMGQQVRVKVASLPNRTFTGRISLMGSVVQTETRVVPVKAELDNLEGELKPGMFAELEVLTEQTSTDLMVIPNMAIVEANGKPLVYVQNGQNFEPVEVSLGQISGDLVEVKSGLFDGDRVVIQGAIQLYAQSLRGGHVKAENASEKLTIENPPLLNNSALPGWWAIAPTVAIAICAFWAGRRFQPRYSAAASEKFVCEFGDGSPFAKASDELPASYVGAFCERPVLAENSHHPQPKE